MVITKQLANLSLYQIMTSGLESPCFEAISIPSGWWQRKKLGKTRFLWGHIAPLLDHGLLDLPGVGPGPSADLLGDVHALLLGLQLGHQLGHVLAGALGLQGTLLLRGVLDNGLGFVITFLSSLNNKNILCSRSKIVATPYIVPMININITQKGKL